MGARSDASDVDLGAKGVAALVERVDLDALLDFRSRRAR